MASWQETYEKLKKRKKAIDMLGGQPTENKVSKVSNVILGTESRKQLNLPRVTTIGNSVSTSKNTKKTTVAPAKSFAQKSIDYYTNKTTKTKDENELKTPLELLQEKNQKELEKQQQDNKKKTEKKKAEKKAKKKAEDPDTVTQNKYLQKVMSEYEGLSKEQLLKLREENTELQKKIIKKDNYKTRNREWWEEEDNLLENLGNVWHNLWTDDPYTFSDEYNEALARQMAIDKALEDVNLKNKEYSKGVLGATEKTTEAFASGFMRGQRGIEATTKKILGQTETETEKEMIDTLGGRQTYIEKLGGKAIQETDNKLGKAALEVTQSIGQMTPQMMLPGGKTATIIGAANFGGSAYSDAKDQGYTEEQATKYGVAVGTIETVLNKILPSFDINGKNIYGKTISDKTISKVMSKVAGNEFLKRTLVQGTGEFTEEYLQEFLEPIVRETLLEEDNGVGIVGEKEAGEIAKNIASYTAENFFNGENFYAGALGFASSGLVGAQSNYNAYQYNKQTGRNVDTGLTQNEQSVIDNVVKTRTSELTKNNIIEQETNKIIKEQEKTLGTLTEAEKTGIRNSVLAKVENGEIDVTDGKLSKKELSKIEEEVRNELDRGEIDIDVIESTLSSEKTAQIKELQERLSKTSNEQEKAQIEAELNEITNAKNTELRDMLQKDNLLQNSYREANLRNEQFTYEVQDTDSEYKKALAEDFKRIANNTTKSHETFEMLSKIAEDKQTSYGVINNNQLKQLGYDVEGKDVNGLVRVNKDGSQKVLINIDSQKAINRIVGHETTHLLEGTKEYNEFKEFAKQYATTKGDYDARLKSTQALYKDIESADIEAEVTADIVGDYLFTDQDFINNLSTEKPTIFQRVYNEIKHLYNLATAGSKEQRQLLQLKKSFEKAYKENVKGTETDTKYSLTDNQGRKLSEQQIEHFKDSKVRDDEGRLLEVYHGSKAKGVNIFNYDPNRQTGEDYGKAFYFTSDYIKAKGYQYDSNIDPRVIEHQEQERAARKKMVDAGFTAEAREEYVKWLDTHSIMDILEDETYIVEHVDEMGGETKKVYLNITNPLMADAKGKYFREVYPEYFKQARENSNNGIIVKNVIDNPGGEPRPIDVYIAFNENQIKNIDNTNPTDNPDIRYSLSPDYGMSHRPSTDYGDASNFEENMPDVFEHPEWYMFGGDSWYKKAYNESWTALKKVRNNPDGEITIYRATIGDTFNEGDWVSPSKAYAEWHNYSNLDGKGKVIELKVKAKDIRFAGDDLNEFGYFPNGVTEYSLSNFNEQDFPSRKSRNDVYGKDIKLQVEEAIAPLQEEINNLNKNLNSLYENIAPEVKQEVAPIEQTIEYTQPTKAELDHLEDTRLNKSGSEYALEFFSLRDKYGQTKLYKGLNEYKSSPETYEAPTNDEFSDAPIPQDIVEQQRQEAFYSLQDKDMPDEVVPVIPENEVTESKSLFETRDYEEVGKRNINAYQYDNPEVKPYFQEAARSMLWDLQYSTKGERYIIGDISQTGNGDFEYTGTKRSVPDDIADLLDGIDGKYKLSYADIEKGLNAIIEDKGSENNAASKRIEFYIDQRLRNGYKDFFYGDEFPPNQEYLNLVSQDNRFNVEEQYNEWLKTLPIEAPIEKTSNKIKTTIKGQEIEWTPQDPTKESSYDEPSITNPYEAFVNKQVAKKNKPTLPVAEQPKVTKQRGTTLDTLNYLFVNRNEAIDRYAKEVDNKNIKILADHVNNVQGEISTNLTKAQIDNHGKVIGKSVTDIFNQARKEGLSEAFDDYLFHKSNIERHKNDKGSIIPANESMELVKEYEKTYPEMKEWANEVNTYNRNNMQKQVDAGLYTQETVDNIKKMYDFYVPFFEDIERNYVPEETGEIKKSGTIKYAKGGADKNLLGFEEAMMRQTQSTITAIRKNQLYQEIVESSQNKTKTEIEDGLYADDSGYYLTAKIDGENVTANISEDLYRGLQNNGEKFVKDLERRLSGITKPLQAISNIRRNVLTTWSPTFVITNPLKDMQDAPLNSKYAKDWALNYPKALKELTTGKGEHIQEFLNMYGQAGLMGDYAIDSGISDITKVKTKNKLSKVMKANEIMEMTPRYAEYLASLKNGTSQMEALYNAREVTTNFGRGGVITKALNRNGFTFLNASVQGFNKLYRNFAEGNGAKGVAQATAKASLKAITLGVVPSLFNALMYGLGDDEDEDYKALPDYIKDNYYLFKTDDGKFIRIPKGRMISIFGSAARRTLELSQGEKDAFDGFLQNAYSQVGIQNPMESNILAPILQATGGDEGQGKTWYGTDLVPSRLQNEDPENQYDASTDKFSIWLGQKTGISPYKINYVLDQYTGGIGDIVLPMITDEAQSDGSILAPITDKFTADSTTDNKYVSDFYTKNDEYYKKAKRSNATEDDKLTNQYMYSVSSEMGELYAEMREVQADKSLSKSEKYEKAQSIKQQINELAEEGLNGYKQVNKVDNYAEVGGREFYKWTNDEGEVVWSKPKEEELDELNSMGLDIQEKGTYYTTKSEIYDVKDAYADKDDYAGKKKAVVETIINSGLPDEAKYYLYDASYGNENDIKAVRMLDLDADTFLDYASQTFKADKDENGKSISGSKKAKVFDYINSMNLDWQQKAILAKLEYNTYDEWNYEIIDYLNNSSMSYEEIEFILKQMGFEVASDGTISWED